MGGQGSGRWRGHAKAMTVESFLVLDAEILRGVPALERGRGVAMLRSHDLPRGFPVPWELRWTNGPELRLSPGTGEQGPIVVALSVRVMPYGGVCWYLRCPECGRRCRKLYLPPAGRGFLRCRQCHGLVYESSQVHRTDGEFIHRGDWAGLHEQLAEVRAQIEKPIDPKMPRRAGARAGREPRPGITNTHW